MAATGTSPASEDFVLASIDRHFPLRHSGLVLGRGDDCAIFRPDIQICTSSDLFLEDVHFRRSYFEPGDIGYKALAVNISDIAAMGAKPFAFTLAIGLPPWEGPDWLDSFFAGMAGLAAQQGMALCGGDISRADKLHISITVFGECLKGHSLLLRGGTMPGDILFIIGSLGLARAGLEELEQRGKEALAEWPAACAAHLRPVPQTGAGLMLARAAHNSRPPALMDLSDGLARDLPRLLGHTEKETCLGADLQLPEDMLHPEVLRHARKTGRDPVTEAFLGGEDYALLGACAADMASILHSAIPGFREIGVVSGIGPVCCNNRDMSALSGFDHFAF